jgi:hypothetical protein
MGVESVPFGATRTERRRANRTVQLLLNILFGTTPHLDDNLHAAEHEKEKKEAKKRKFRLRRGGFTALAVTRPLNEGENATLRDVFRPPAHHAA